MNCELLWHNIYELLWFFYSFFFLIILVFKMISCLEDDRRSQRQLRLVLEVYTRPHRRTQIYPGSTGGSILASQRPRSSLIVQLFVAAESQILVPLKSPLQFYHGTTYFGGLDFLTVDFKFNMWINLICQIWIFCAIFLVLKWNKKIYVKNKIYNKLKKIQLI